MDTPLQVGGGEGRWAIIRAAKTNTCLASQAGWGGTWIDIILCYADTCMAQPLGGLDGCFTTSILANVKVWGVIGYKEDK